LCRPLRISRHNNDCGNDHSQEPGQIRTIPVFLIGVKIEAGKCYQKYDPGEIAVGAPVPRRKKEQPGGNETLHSTQQNDRIQKAGHRLQVPK